MSGESWLVTGGTGFIGSALVRRLVGEGHRVRVLDDQSRGSARRLLDLENRYELMAGDVRDPGTVARAARGMNGVCHLAAVNGTEFFYTRPELVLEVGVKGLVNVLEACRSEQVGQLIIASSSEVYQTPPTVPTPETVPLSVPDPWNPRYSYGTTKILSEMMGIHWGGRFLKRVVLFRPHNVYGPDMGWEHVIPSFLVRMKALCAAHPKGRIAFPIQGTGTETRAFVYIDDFIDGLALVIAKGTHRGLYNIGTMEEVEIGQVARAVATFYGREIDMVPGPAAEGGTLRRCPDIGKLTALGFRPRYTLETGLLPTAQWYDEHAAEAPLAGAV